MNFNRLKEFVLVPSIVNCVGYKIISNDFIHYSFIKLEKSKKGFNILSKKDDIKDINELLNQLDSSIPMILSIDGRYIINKKIQVSENDSEEKILKNILPNAVTNDFYLQKNVSATDGQTFVSVIRRDTLDNILDIFLKDNKNIIECSLGPNSLKFLSEYFNKNELNILSGYSIHLIEGNINFINESIETSTISEINFHETNIKENLFLTLSVGLNFFRTFLEINNPSLLLKEKKRKFIDQNISKSLSYFILGFIFILLLGNYIYFSHLNKKYNELNSQSIIDKSITDKYKQLQKEIEEKSTLIELTGLKSTQHSSFYVDHLAKELPRGIVLTELNFQPYEINRSNTENPLFNYKKIAVTGNCNTSISLNDWIKKIQNEKWVNKIAISNYLHDPEKERAQFLLDISIK
jgi:hypothetical protein